MAASRSRRLPMAASRSRRLPMAARADTQQIAKPPSGLLAAMAAELFTAAGTHAHTRSRSEQNLESEQMVWFLDMLNPQKKIRKERRVLIHLILKATKPHARSCGRFPGPGGLVL